MKKILLIGAGKSATVLIDYLKKLATLKQWQVTVADHDLNAALQKVGAHQLVTAVQLKIQHEEFRKKLIQEADIVISMMPAALHNLIAMDCIAFKKNLLTASYIDPVLREQEDAVKEAGLLFLGEMGLDPGIDHMSAMQLINRIKSQGGVITSFKSHCGGLVAPDSDDNPWRYKISWNPRNVVLAGKSGAIYRENGKTVEIGYPALFDNCPEVYLDGLGKLACYSNRDSLSYIPIYNLHQAETFKRTTLRFPVFCKGWKAIADLKLTEESPLYDTTTLSFADFFTRYFKENQLDPLYQQFLKDATLAQQFDFLGFHDTTIIDKGNLSPADILQLLLEQKLALANADRDMIVMLHEIEYMQNGVLHYLSSSLVVEGDDPKHTAMAKTVGLPLGIAAKLILEGAIKETGIHVPVIPSIYHPVLDELANAGIRFKEN